MRKDKALELLGGAHAAADAIGVTYQAIDKWPELPPLRIADRVIAALVRQKRRVPAELLKRPSAKD